MPCGSGPKHMAPKQVHTHLGTRCTCRCHSATASEVHSRRQGSPPAHTATTESSEYEARPQWLPSGPYHTALPLLCFCCWGQGRWLGTKCTAALATGTTDGTADDTTNGSIDGTTKGPHQTPAPCLTFRLLTTASSGRPCCLVRLKYCGRHTADTQVLSIQGCCGRHTDRI